MVHPSEFNLVVKGVNVVKRHQKATASREAGIVDKELPINISNVAYLDPKESKPTKIGYKFEVFDIDKYVSETLPEFEVKIKENNNKLLFEKFR